MSQKSREKSSEMQVSALYSVAGQSSMNGFAGGDSIILSLGVEALEHCMMHTRMNIICFSHDSLCPNTHLINVTPVVRDVWLLYSSPSPIESQI